MSGIAVPVFSVNWRLRLLVDLHLGAELTAKEGEAEEARDPKFASENSKSRLC